MSDLERFKKLERRAAEEPTDDAPDPFAPPPEKVAPIVLDMRDDVEQTKVKEEKVTRAARDLALHEQRVLDGQMSKHYDENTPVMRTWQALGRLPLQPRLAILALAVGGPAALALLLHPVFWILALVGGVFVGTTFLARQI